MKTQYGTGPCWSTTANNQGADSFRLDASVLREHIKYCRKPYGRLHGMVCAATAMQGFVASRFVTTLVVVTALIVVSSLVI